MRIVRIAVYRVVLLNIQIQASTKLKKIKAKRVAIGSYDLIIMDL